MFSCTLVGTGGRGPGRTDLLKGRLESTWEVEVGWRVGWADQTLLSSMSLPLPQPTSTPRLHSILL